MQQLPRGRHRLSREEVTASQRGRMLAAMAEAVAEKTFARTSVTDVVKRAGVSRETFYEHFADKEACFLAAYEAAADLLRTALAEEFARSPGEGDGTPAGAVRKAMSVYLETLAAEPAIAQTFLVEVYAAGHEARVRRAAVQHRFAETVAAALGASTDRERFAAEAIVGAISSLVTLRVSVGEAERLPELLEPIMGLVEPLLAAREH